VNFQSQMHIRNETGGPCRCKRLEFESEQANAGRRSPNRHMSSCSEVSRPVNPAEEAEYPPAAAAGHARPPPAAGHSALQYEDEDDDEEWERGAEDLLRSASLPPPPADGGAAGAAWWQVHRGALEGVWPPV
jgi:hypothetical protein